MKEVEINCPLCGVLHLPEIGIKTHDFPNRPPDVREDHPAFLLCYKCARVAANAYNLSLSGEPLTWRPLSSGPRGKVKAIIQEDLRWRVFERDGFACKHCGGQQMLRADHIHPESLGGEATFENLQTLCNRCNSRKGNKVAA